VVVALCSTAHVVPVRAVRCNLQGQNKTEPELGALDSPVGAGQLVENRALLVAGTVRAALVRMTI
jgi:hypothetical protein